MRVAVSRAILTTPDPHTGVWIEKSILDVQKSRGAKCGRSNFVAACLKAIAACGMRFNGCTTDAHVTARVFDALHKGTVDTSKPEVAIQEEWGRVDELRARPNELQQQIDATLPGAK